MTDNDSNDSGCLVWLALFALHTLISLNSATLSNRIDANSERLDKLEASETEEPELKGREDE